MKEYKVHDEALNGNRKLINAVKKARIETYHPRGEWNGYGYPPLPLAARVASLGEQRKFNKIKKEVLAEQEAHPKRKRTQAEVITAWAKRLVRLYNSTLDDDEIEEKLTLEDAIDIAYAKLDYKDQKINDMYTRENTRGYSRRRITLIHNMQRENPLRYIRDVDHACAIVAAHERHASGYDADLEYAHELEEDGTIEKGSAREVARQLYHGDFDYTILFD